MKHFFKTILFFVIEAVDNNVHTDAVATHQEIHNPGKKIKKPNK